MVAGDLGNLDVRHLSCSRPTPRLDYRWTSAYKVQAVHGASAKLSFPAGSKKHLTVNFSYLRRFNDEPLPGQVSDAKFPDQVIAGKDPLEDEFEVTCILDARINRHYCGGRLQFRVAWRGWPYDYTWYNAADSKFSHANDFLDEFYTLPSTTVHPPRSTKSSPPAPPTDKSWDEPFLHRGKWCYRP